MLPMNGLVWETESSKTSSAQGRNTSACIQYPSNTSISISSKTHPVLLHSLKTAAASVSLRFPLSCLFSFCYRKTTRSALSAITEQTEEAAAWFSRLWGLPFSIIFGSGTICAACVRMHMCSVPLPHFFFFPFLPACLSVCSYLLLLFSPHDNISSFLLNRGP